MDFFNDLKGSGVTLASVWGGGIAYLIAEIVLVDTRLFTANRFIVVDDGVWLSDVRERYLSMIGST